MSNFQKIGALDLADDVSAAILSPHLSLIVCKVHVMLFILFTCDVEHSYFSFVFVLYIYKR